jgi:hypothetical protein
MCCGAQLVRTVPGPSRPAMCDVEVIHQDATWASRPPAADTISTTGGRPVPPTTW